MSSTEEAKAEEATAEDKPAEAAADDKPAEAAADDKPAEAATTASAADKPAEAAEAGNKDTTGAVDELVRRLSFFFSDANIRQDKFMRKLLITDDKVVPIETLLKFNTIKQHTTDPTVLIQAIKSERLAQIIKLTEDSKGVKRVHEFTMDLMSKNIPLSLVLKNLPIRKDGQGKTFYDVKVDEINDLFQQYGDVALVKLRFGPAGAGEQDTGDDLEQAANNDDDNDDNNNNNEKEGKSRPSASRKTRYVPNGTCLVEFYNLESLQAAAKDVLTLKDGAVVEPNRKLEVKGNVLGVVLLQEFLDELKKNNMDRAKKAEPKSGDNSETNGQEEDQMKTQGNTSASFSINWKPGCVLKLKELPSSCDREALLDAVCKCLDKSLDELKQMRVFIDYSRGRTEGAIRFVEPGEVVTKVLDKLKNGQVEVAGKKMTDVTQLEGEEEKKYWDGFLEFKNKQKRQRDSRPNSHHRHHHHQNNNHRYGGGGGGRQGGYKKRRKS